MVDFLSLPDCETHNTHHIRVRRQHQITKEHTLSVDVIHTYIVVTSVFTVCLTYVCTVEVQQPVLTILTVGFITSDELT